MTNCIRNIIVILVHVLISSRELCFLGYQNSDVLRNFLLSNSELSDSKSENGAKYHSGLKKKKIKSYGQC